MKNRWDREEIYQETRFLASSRLSPVAIALCIRHIQIQRKFRQSSEVNHGN
ncbi:hypothetical protein [Microseira wollei]|uniref:hypothetical protein n=1 Tax=Microseira wollei TaxID=467598 RepID=UPI001CFD515D|nr:hypothetical protein [Microseira wollei]